MISLPAILQCIVTQTKVLHTQVPKYPNSEVQKIGSMNVNTFAQLSTTPSTQTNREKQRAIFPVPLGNTDTDFWQTLRINSETTLEDVLIYFRQKTPAKIWKSLQKQLKPTDVQPQWRKFHRIPQDTQNAKQAIGNKASKLVDTFLLGNLPIQIQSELSFAGKSDPSIEELKLFIQWRYQYQELIPQQMPTMRIHDISSRSKRSPLGTHTSTQANDCLKSREDCRHCRKKCLRSANTKVRNVLGPTNNHKGKTKNNRRKNNISRTLNRCAIRVGSLVTQNQTADTEQKGTLGNVPY